MKRLAALPHREPLTVHRWRDTITILAAVVVLLALAVAGIDGKTILQIG